MTTDREGFYLDRCVYERDECGSRRSEPDTCPECGGPLEDGAYCDSCAVEWSGGEPICTACSDGMVRGSDDKLQCLACDGPIEEGG